MKSFELHKMTAGWFVGGFQPTAFSSDACEVAVKRYQKGSFEKEHYHKIATEITCIVEGEVIMCGKKWTTGDIIVLEPGEITSFEALTDVITTVVKLPGALNDKYVV
ncbi:hypothetical protein ABEG93_09010 [Pantoea agglomerans]|uniref:hypothetical protein n=1 Tax=Enterobacter agglomerans TaxID=549 RepID=UPI0007E553F5|nr:hypothetical protein [Pantoea agglomerans]WHU87596.1 hypothetical protein A7P62_17265 [Pantoea agglomerans pv. gypsophilae]